jgi:hypothetical protein
VPLKGAEMSKRAKRRPDIERLFDHKRVEYVALSDQRREEEQVAWRRAFATKLYEQRGVWTLNDFDWDALCSIIPCLEHDEARAEYLRQEVAPFLVLPHMDTGMAYLCTAKHYPDFHGKGEDFYVCSPSMSWTMVFPHEAYGPYFTTPAMARGE